MTRCTVLCGMSRLVLAGGLSLAVEGPSKAEIVCQDNDDGTCTVTYLPTEPGLYNIVVKFDDEHILGSPFTAYIAGELVLLVLGLVFLNYLNSILFVNKF